MRVFNFIILNIIDKKISLTGIDLLNFSGINEENLNIVKERFDSTIVVRGDSLFLKGEENEVSLIEKIFNELIFLQKRQGKISLKMLILYLNL
ncbi:MAG: hypothetical protein IPM96_08820 [Ignavibacteria bacterium]|nr:hypothetical protein [Ignavibacteria bacterium]